MTIERGNGISPDRMAGRLTFGDAFKAPTGETRDRAEAFSFTLPKRPDHTVVIAKYTDAEDKGNKQKVSCTVYRELGIDPETEQPIVKPIHEVRGLSTHEAYHPEDPRFTSMPYHKEIIDGMRSAIEARNTAKNKVMPPNVTHATHLPRT